MSQSKFTRSKIRFKSESPLIELHDSVTGETWQLRQLERWKRITPKDILFSDRYRKKSFTAMERTLEKANIAHENVRWHRLVDISSDGNTYHGVFSDTFITTRFGNSTVDFVYSGHGVFKILTKAVGEERKRIGQYAKDVIIPLYRQETLPPSVQPSRQSYQIATIETAKIETAPEILQTKTKEQPQHAEILEEALAREETGDELSDRPAGITVELPRKTRTRVKKSDELLTETAVEMPIEKMLEEVEKVSNSIDFVKRLAYDRFLQALSKYSNDNERRQWIVRLAYKLFVEGAYDTKKFHSELGLIAPEIYSSEIRR